MLYAIYDPESPPSAPSAESQGNPATYCIALPASAGDLSAAGHAWNADGNLLVAGGSLSEAANTGSTLAFVWEPPTTTTDGGTWHSVVLPTQMEPGHGRRFPAVVALGPDPTNDRDFMMVAGGLNALPENHYLIWEPDGTKPGRWLVNDPYRSKPLHFLGPQQQAFFSPWPAPGHLVAATASNGSENARVFFPGNFGISNRTSHYAAAEVWHGAGPWGSPGPRIYGSSVLWPFAVSVDLWRVLTVGGFDAGPGGYNTYEPHYVNCTSLPRPVIAAPTGAAHYTFPYGTSPFLSITNVQAPRTVTRITLLRPGSVTQHMDPNQRSVDLNFVYTEQPNQIRVFVPGKNQATLPCGFYMMFAVTDFASDPPNDEASVPSEAVWVKIV